MGLLNTSELSVEVGGFMGQSCLPPRSLIRGNEGLSVYYNCKVEKLAQICTYVRLPVVKAL